MKNRSKGKKKRRLALAGDVRVEAPSESGFLQSTMERLLASSNVRMPAQNLRSRILSFENVKGNDD